MQNNELKDSKTVNLFINYLKSCCPAKPLNL